MSKYRIIETTRFIKETQAMEKRGFDMSLLDDVVTLLKNGVKLPKTHKDHALKGDLKGYRECHIKNDWLLVYKIYKNDLILLLSRTGSHSDLF
ncbi:MAG: type II toxin-antitoxin system YafQ family toxin [Candidatus Cloacimonetes bacterium]|nr:type II toxin-antitoxin system YafQ family toxin [Candidatus Cloacimonadota bacterium]